MGTWVCGPHSRPPAPQPAQHAPHWQQQGYIHELRVRRHIQNGSSLCQWAAGRGYNQAGAQVLSGRQGGNTEGKEQEERRRKRRGKGNRGARAVRPPDREPVVQGQHMPAQAPGLPPPGHRRRLWRGMSRRFCSCTGCISAIQNLTAGVGAGVAAALKGDKFIQLVQKVRVLN